jgi:hypothetical protein
LTARVTTALSVGRCYASAILNCSHALSWTTRRVAFITSSRSITLPDPFDCPLAYRRLPNRAAKRGGVLHALSAWRRSIHAARQRPITAYFLSAKSIRLLLVRGQVLPGLISRIIRNLIMRAISTIGIAIGITIILAIAFTAGLFLPDLARAQNSRGGQEPFAIARWN